MVISVSFFGLQRKLVQTDRVQVLLSSKIRVVDDLFHYIKKRYPALSLSKESVLVTVNNYASSLDHELRPDDEVSFMPHIGGG
ncbi:MoaD/ThiS family protein [Deltaproteobacteria bacterium]|nr:MoaD/ThiS family protein [Deltaproteobacteria bacterium]